MERKNHKSLIILLGITILLYSCASPDAGESMKLTSSVFAEGAEIPSKYTCEGPNVIPPLQIADVPANAKSLALIMDDPDAVRGIWDHWIVWNIPTTTTNIDKQPAGVKGKNSRGDNEYHGPCPPSQFEPKRHRYFFKLYALDTMLDIPEGSTKAEVENAMKGKIIAETKLMGTYQKVN